VALALATPLAGRAKSISTPVKIFEETFPPIPPWERCPCPGREIFKSRGIGIENFQELFLQLAHLLSIFYSLLLDAKFQNRGSEGGHEKNFNSLIFYSLGLDANMFSLIIVKIISHKLKNNNKSTILLGKFLHKS